MAKRKHIIIDDPGEERNYTRPPGGGGEFSTPPRDRRVHARKLLSDVEQARDHANAHAEETRHIIHDLCLEIIGEQDYALKIESLEYLRSGIEVRSVKRLGNRIHATIYVPEGKLANFVRKIERYERENTRSNRPKNEDLVAGISGIRFPVLRSFWTDDENLFPSSNTECIWWEVWIRVLPSENLDNAFALFVAATADSNLHVSQHAIKFPERLVFLAYGSAQDWTQIFVPLLDRIAEFRKAKEIPTEYIRLSAHDQRSLVNNLAGRVVLPGANAPAVCLLDFGVHIEHPLLRSLITDDDAQAYDPEWSVVDNTESHGTEMAGLAIFGDKLPELLAGNQRISLTHRLESVRMLHSNQSHAEDTWGYVTQECLSKAETQASQRSRVACLPVTSNDEGRDHGRPSSWSGAIDQHASGKLDNFQRLYVIAAGNVRDIMTRTDYSYPESNLVSSVEDPGQSWNALTVGAFTERVQIQSEDFDGFQPLATQGGLCPSSRTSDSWEDKVWPLKPDIVMEGGNYARSPSGRVDGCVDLALLTTSLYPTGRLLTWSSDTSAATAQAARLAAILMADYPELWPETIRGLLVHSADWTDEMNRQISGDREEDRHHRLRCFGYGVPNLDRARYTVENCVSLVHQGTIQPYKLEGTEAKTNHFMLHSLPWPRASLEELHDQDVTVKITLSYFIEPSPAGRGWGKKFRYASHGLRFALRGPTETEYQFRQRISRQEWEEDQDGRPSTSDPINWSIGVRLRTKGSIHCDWVTSSAEELARCDQVAVFPVTGWWRERKHLGFVDKQTRYSLIITISTPATEIDLYTPIAQEVGLITEIST
ncbi:MAG TPA: S8 family peptidase [Sedimentisphaerales bacterium]|nr:S8 family peptidase [Sedimentisphaerales bacterium]